MQWDLLEGSEPLGKGRGISDRSREPDNLYGGREKNETLFPDLAAIRIVDVVTFVKDNHAEVLEGQGGRETERLCLGTALVEQIAKDLRGHDEDLGIRSILDIARHDADRCLRELAFQVTELLVGQGFDGGGNEGSLAFCKCLEDGELSDSALTCTRRSTGKNIMIQMDGFLGILLERIERMLERIGREAGYRNGKVRLNEIGHSWQQREREIIQIFNWKIE